MPHLCRISPRPRRLRRPPAPPIELTRPPTTEARQGYPSAPLCPHRSARMGAFSLPLPIPKNRAAQLKRENRRNCMFTCSPTWAKETCHSRVIGASQFKAAPLFQKDWKHTGFEKYSAFNCFLFHFQLFQFFNDSVDCARWILVFLQLLCPLYCLYHIFHHIHLVG